MRSYPLSSVVGLLMVIYTTHYVLFPVLVGVYDVYVLYYRNVCKYSPICRNIYEMSVDF